MVEGCTFCRIVSGELPAFTVYDDEHVKAFLDISPVTKGHTLIVPKKHYTNLYDIPDDELARVTSVAKELALKYIKAINANAVNLLHASGKEADQSVLHFHLHLVPRYADDHLTNLWFQNAPLKIDLKEVIEEIMAQK